MRRWRIAVAAIAILGGCSGEQVDKFVADVQPTVAVTLRDGKAIVMIETCDSSLTSGVTVQLGAQSSPTETTVLRSVGEVPAGNVTASDGQTTVDVTGVLAQASIDPSTLTDDQWLLFGFKLDNGYSATSLLPTVGAWPSYPRAAVLKPDVDDSPSRDIESDPLACGPGS